MATNVKLPDMGEGIDDVTINRWLVEEGDTIEEGAMLVEVATDKVDTEVPPPAGGTILTPRTCSTIWSGAISTGC